jgi:mannose-6-phosphate isomerase-like protein (cupin superfamily)
MNVQRITRIVPDSNGVSHFQDLELSLRSHPAIPRTDAVRVKSASFILAEDVNMPIHPAPRRQFVVVLTGAIEIQCGDSEVRRISAGEVLLVEDVSGAGHSFRTVSEPTRLINLPLADDEFVRVNDH